MKNKGNISYLISIILAAILILIVAGLVWKVSISLTNFGITQECKSVLTTGGIMQVLNPNAPIKAAKPNQQFDSDISLCPINTITYKKRTNHELVKQDIANEMVSCYHKYGRGEINLFEQKPGRNLYCVMCTYIDFNGIDGPIEGLVDYMNEKEIDGMGVTYSEFLAGGSSKQAIDNIKIPEPEESLSLNTNKEYAIYFVYGKTRDFWSDKLGNNLKMGAVGTVGGTAVGIGVVVATSAAWFVVVPVALVSAGIGFFSGPDAVPDEFMGMVMITEHDADIIEQLDCTDFGARTK